MGFSWNPIDWVTAPYKQAGRGAVQVASSNSAQGVLAKSSKAAPKPKPPAPKPPDPREFESVATPISYIPTPIENPSIFDDLIALLGQQGSGGGAVQYLGPKLGDYIGPYEEAAMRAGQSYDQAVPAIAGAYNDLRSNLGARQSEFANIQNQVTAAEQARQQQAAQSIQGLLAPAQNDLAAQSGGTPLASLTAGLQAQGNQMLANQQAQATNQNNLMGNLAASNAAAQQDRIQSTDVAQQNSVAATQQNLNSILNQLGLAKAGAQRQFATDEQQAKAAYAAQQSAAASQRFDSQRQILELKAQQAQSKNDSALNNYKAYQQALDAGVSPSEEFESSKVERREKFPVAMGYFDDLTKSAGGDKSLALQLLREAKSDKKSGLHDLKLEGQTDTIQNWINAYYDKEKKPDQKALVALVTTVAMAVVNPLDLVKEFDAARQSYGQLAPVQAPIANLPEIPQFDVPAMVATPPTPKPVVNAGSLSDLVSAKQQPATPAGQLVDYKGYQFDGAAFPKIQQVTTKFPGLRVTSGYRSPEKNAKTPGAAKNSKHMKGTAVDFVGSAKDMAAAELYARSIGATEALRHNAGTGYHLHVSW